MFICLCPSADTVLAAVGRLSAVGGAELVFAVVRKHCCWEQGCVCNCPSKATLAFLYLFLTSGLGRSSAFLHLSKAP